MSFTFEQLMAHLKRTGKVKLLPSLLGELRKRAERERVRAPKKETAQENPSLISGWRSFENGMLTDRTGKRALLEMYQRSIT